MNALNVSNVSLPFLSVMGRCLILLLMGCNSQNSDESISKPSFDAGISSNDASIHETDEFPLAFIESPTFVGNSNPAAPLAGVLSLETNQPADIVIKIEGSDGETWSIERSADPLLSTPIVGLKPKITYTASVVATANNQTLSSSAGMWTTPALPEGFPPIDVIQSMPELMEPGMIQMNIWNKFHGNNKPLVIVDNQGAVRWYYDDAPVFDDHRLIQNDHFLFSPDECLLYEIDMLGNLSRSWYATKHPLNCDFPEGAIPVEVESFHHSMAQLESGNLLILSTELRPIENFPTSDTDPNAESETAVVMGSIIVEFTPDGDILKYIPLLDLLDPTRISRGALTATWRLLQKYTTDDVTPKDWDHSNALHYDPATDSYLVSVRHQDAIIKINRETETLDWILGTPANWKSPWKEKLLIPDESVQWFYHQHAVTLTQYGLGLYDNGNYRAAAFEPSQTSYSRAVLFDIDEAAGTVSQLWQYGEPSGENSFYSRAMGNATWQTQTGNTLICNAYIVNETVYPEVIEVTTEGKRVFEMNVKDSEENYAMHRARRIRDIRYE